VIDLLKTFAVSCGIIIIIMFFFSELIQCTTYIDLFSELYDTMYTIIIRDSNHNN